MSALLLLSGLAVVLLGAHMMRRPAIYVGRGTAPLSSPATARRVGLFTLIAGDALIALAVILFVTE